MRVLATVSCLLLLTAACSAFPTYWAGIAGCEQHPSNPIASHLAPEPDRDVIFTLTAIGSVRSKHCPGQLHTLQIEFASPRFAYVTTSIGVLSSDNNKGNKCPNRLVLDKWACSNLSAPQKSYEINIQTGCSDLGSLQVQVTSSSDYDQALRQASVWLEVDPSCAAPSCNLAATASPSPSPSDNTSWDPSQQAWSSPSPASSLPLPAEQQQQQQQQQQPGGSPATSSPEVLPNASLAPGSDLEGADDAVRSGTMTSMGSSGSQQGAVGNDCVTSDLGYACAAVVERGVVHWSIGTPVPDNPCTRAAVAASGRSKEDLSAGLDPSGMAHFAFQGYTTGWVALSLAQTAGKMFPADAVIGHISGDGQGNVQSYNLQSYQVDFGSAYSGWASHLGVVQANNNTWVCFSRLLVQPNAKVVPVIKADNNTNGAGSSLALNWAVGAVGSIGLSQHRYAGGVMVSPAGASIATDDSYRRWVMLHGLFMSLAWVLLIPLGVTAAAQKWICGAEVKGCASWFWLHFLFNGGGLGCFGYAYYIAFTKLHNPSAFSPVANVHPKLGFAILITSGVQLIAGLLRPGQNSTYRARWRLLHASLGRVVLGAGWSNVIIGVLLFHWKLAEPLLRWLVPIAGTMGLMLLLNIVLLSCSGSQGRRALQASHQLDAVPDVLPVALPAIRTSPPRGVRLGAGGRLQRSPSGDPFLARGSDRSDNGSVASSSFRMRDQQFAQVVDRRSRRPQQQPAAAAPLLPYQQAPLQPYQPVPSQPEPAYDQQVNPLYEYAPQQQYMAAVGAGPAGYGNRDQRDNPVYSPPGNSPQAAPVGRPAAPAPAGYSQSYQQMQYRPPPAAQQGTPSTFAPASGGYRVRDSSAQRPKVDLTDALESQRRARREAAARRTAEQDQA